ncbi:putative alpha/beta hydrolase family protein DUF2235 [Isoptericola jiangsuensis]|uniref:Putative alpha/beta hydrolase family protein DUF2235 n=1 Tax=Isoptericola jiangsuensis TaxID=548579 RepID=A0A2A9ETE2_9MICO|nr:DUF2235 domain-containing protein [Isoptericola jiangsuensis]PFG42407.1 putative alpha/beta hydrolase family protein DUF2235 [Isoptericola jiangsuensis]
MKRLVLCCDGTWNHAVNSRVTNVEKLERCVVQGLVPNPDGDDAVQIVGYVGGVGARGYKVDQLLGGAFGYGLTRNVVDGYRFLATTSAEHDEIYVVGFSRGAFTARSVVGMISQVGLLTPEAVDAGMLDDALRTYRIPLDAPGAKETKAAFKAEHSASPRVRFLGVYDTVGALGVPGITRGRSRFHDVVLSGIVDTARQALAIDERRMTFTPCLWRVPDGDTPGRVQQVWFPGAHSDVGGGAPRSGLSDVALHWMADELERAGLVLDRDRLARQRGHDPLVLDPRPHVLFRALNLGRRVVSRSGLVDGRQVFRDGLRVLALEPPATPGTATASAVVTAPTDGDTPATPAAAARWADAVALADTATRYAQRDHYTERARNLAWWVEAAGGLDLVPTVDVGAADDERPLLTA